MTKAPAKIETKPEEVKKEELKKEEPTTSTATKASNELPKGPPKKLDTSWLTAAQNKSKINPFGQKKPDDSKPEQPNRVNAKAQDGLFGAPINKGTTSSGNNPFGQPKNATTEKKEQVKNEEPKKVEPKREEPRKEVVQSTNDEQTKRMSIAQLTDKGKPKAKTVNSQKQEQEEAKKQEELDKQKLVQQRMKKGIFDGSDSDDDDKIEAKKVTQPAAQNKKKNKLFDSDDDDEEEEKDQEKTVKKDAGVAKTS